MTIRLERVALDVLPWDDCGSGDDRSVGQTRAWLDFVVDTQSAEAVAARVLDGTRTVGWYRGAIVRRAGLAILGSPLRGWTTSTMGFSLEAGADRAAALRALRPFAFTDLRCAHLEVADRGITDADAAASGLRRDDLPGWELALGASDDELLAHMNQMARRNIRKAEQAGIAVEEVDPFAPGDFVGEYFSQVSEAFARRRRRPPYGPDRVTALIDHLGPAGNLLLLQARGPDGAVVATALSTGIADGPAEFWAGASRRNHPGVAPNELVMWESLRRWRERGAIRFNFGGGGPYKQKFGGDPHVQIRLHGSRFGVIDTARATVVAAERRLRLHRARRAGAPPAK